MAKRTSDLNSIIMELTGRVKACEEEIAEGPDEMRGHDVDDNNASSMGKNDVGKSVHGDLQSGDDEDGVNIGEDIKQSMHKKSSHVISQEPASAKIGNKPDLLFLKKEASAASKGSLISPEKMSPKRKLSLKKIPPPSS